MELELLMRRERKNDSMSKEDREDYNLQKLFPNFDEDKWMEEHTPKREYDYVPVTIDVRDACPYSMHDDGHTHIFLRTGLSFIAKVDYDTFQVIRNAMLGQNTKSVEDFNIEVVVPPPAPAPTELPTKTKTKNK